MQKIINKANWSGEKAKIRINKSKNTLSLYGVCGEPKMEVFTIKNGKVYNKNFSCSVCHIEKCIINNDIWYKAYNYYTSRESLCKYIAIAQLLYNIL